MRKRNATKQGKYYHAQFCKFSFKFAYLKKKHMKNGLMEHKVFIKIGGFSSINLLLKSHTKFFIAYGYL